MTDIRARLADALLSRYPEFDWGRSPVFDDLLDMLLSLPGIAIVDADDEATLERVQKAIWDENGRNYDAEGNFITIDVRERHRNMARAALLAAAAEREAK